jgi:hypothetical protein
MSRVAFGLRYFLFGLGSALDTGQHVARSIDRTEDCPSLCHAVCAISITATYSKLLALLAASEWIEMALGLCRPLRKAANRGVSNCVP